MVTASVMNTQHPRWVIEVTLKLTKTRLLADFLKSKLSKGQLQMLRGEIINKIQYTISKICFFIIIL